MWERLERLSRPYMKTLETNQPTNFHEVEIWDMATIFLLCFGISSLLLQAHVLWLVAPSAIAMNM
jgi:hypothetical protein